MNPQKRKAVSPVIATVILVAVAITVAVGVSYWMGGISSQYTQFEKVEIQTGYSEAVTNGWKITMSLKNSGTADATIDQLFINDKPINATGYIGVGAAMPANAAGDLVTTSIASTGVSMAAGSTSTIYVYIYNDGTNGYASLSSGTTVNVKVHSAGGMDYIKLLELS